MAPKRNNRSSISSSGAAAVQWGTVSLSSSCIDQDGFQPFSGARFRLGGERSQQVIWPPSVVEIADTDAKVDETDIDTGDDSFARLTACRIAAGS